MGRVLNKEVLKGVTRNGGHVLDHPRCPVFVVTKQSLGMEYQLGISNWVLATLSVSIIRHVISPSENGF